MEIQVFEQEGIFQLNTEHTTYLMGLADGKYLGHLYYGRRMQDHEGRYLLRAKDSAQEVYKRYRDKINFMDSFHFEYPVSGTGDFRDPGLRVRDEGGYRVCELHYAGYEILDGKPALKGMPATFAGKQVGQAAKTLVIVLRDEVLKLKIELRYSIFEDNDAIIRSVVAVNEGEKKLYLERILSACMDMDNDGFDRISLHGCWARERHIQAVKLGQGRHVIGSVRGESSHYVHPFLALTTAGTSQKMGEVYAMNFIYSGNFLAEAELDHRDSVRMSMGLHPDGFEWVLAPGERFETPEAVLVYSAAGLGPMTRTFHSLYRNHLIRSKYLQCDTGPLLQVSYLYIADSAFPQR